MLKRTFSEKICISLSAFPVESFLVIFITILDLYNYLNILVSEYRE